MRYGLVGFTRKIEYAASKSRLAYWAASLYYRNVIKNEIDLANITSKDHILCIGGGICPFSAILFHEKTGARVTVIDNCEKCVPQAERVVSQLGLDGHVNVLWQDGSDIELKPGEFSVVHFALQVFPMESVFTQVGKQVGPGTKLLVRKSKNDFDGIYKADSCIACCHHVTHQKACNIGSTLLYIK